MCGIAGLVTDAPDAARTVAAMTRAIAHRGPDAEGFADDGRAHLGHRRLSVIDVAGSPQPMYSADGAVVLIYNGEIYNYRELRDELARGGYRFRTAGDTEVLIAGWYAWGERVVERLRGMFAFALWDARSATFFAARDHVGVKPFHYAWDGRALVFGSELKAVLASAAVARDVDLASLRLYLECQFVPQPATIFRGVRKLPPAHTLTLRGSDLVVRRYWEPRYEPKHRFADADAAAALERELMESVRGMLIADVPLGAFLSGGVDSSLVAALMTKLVDGPVDTFNIGFEGDVDVSEHREAARVARHLRSRHHAVMLGADDVLDAFDHWVDVFDEPFADQAALPTMLLAEYARRHVTVVLTGEGADELFGGYTNYRKRIAEEWLTRWLGAPMSPARAVVAALPTRWRKDRLLRAIAEPLPRRYRSIPNLFDALLMPELLSPAMLAATRGAADAGELAAAHFARNDAEQYLDKLLHVDLSFWLPDDLLTKVDRATMAHSLEARVPYLDHRVVEFCSRLAPRHKIRGREHKWLLKRVAERYLPTDIVERGKQGFVMPLSQWLEGRLSREIDAHLGPGGLDRRGIFRRGALARLVTDHRAGTRRHAGRLWALLILERWFRRYLPDWTLSS